MINSQILENYYRILKDNFQTGSDRVTATKYEIIKDEEFKLIEKKVNKHTYHFIRYQKRALGKRMIFSPAIRDKIVLKFLADKLQYNVKFTSRDIIISHLKMLFDENIDYSILRVDIKSFYDSILIKNVLTKLSRTSLLRPY